MFKCFKCFTVENIYEVYNKGTDRSYFICMDCLKEINPRTPCSICDSDEIEAVEYNDLTVFLCSSCLGLVDSIENN